jgi:HEAT repeat protein
MTTGGRATPREAVAGECTRLGEHVVVATCIDLLGGGDADDDFLMAVSTGAATQVLEGRAGGRSGYWPRVWGARALLYAWDDTAAPVVVRATADEHWRVREMAARVIGHRLVGDGLAAVARLRGDPVPRVRAAAERALVALTAAGA